MGAVIESSGANGPRVGLSLRFDVFISYSRKDLAFAKAFERALRAYVPPKDLPVPQRRLSVFRDQTDLVGVELAQALEANLRNASKLVVLCSPDARQSPYVNSEIASFSRARGAEHLVPLLVRGVPNNEAPAGDASELAFPDALVNALPTPLASEFRGFRPTKDRFATGAFESAWFKTLAELYSEFGVERAQIEQRERKRRARQRAIVTSVVGAIGVALCALTVWALVERSEAVRQRNAAVSRELASQSLNWKDTRPDLAFLLAVAAHRSAPTIEARQGLQASFLARPRLQKLLWGHQADVQSLAFSPDGRRVAAAGEDQRLIVWDVASGKPVLELATRPGKPDLSSGEGRVENVLFTRDGRRLLVANRDGTIPIFDASTGKLIATAGEADARISRVSLSPDGRRLAAGLWDGTIAVWSVETGAKLAESRPHDYVSDLEFSPDGRRIASVGSDGKLAFWSAETADPASVTALRAGKLAPSSVAFSPDGQLTAIGYAGGQVKLSTAGGDFVDLDPAAAPKKEDEEIEGNLLAFSPNGEWLASAGTLRGSIVVWNPRTRQLRATLAGIKWGPHAIRFSHDGRWLAAVSGDGLVRQWETEQFSLVSEADGGSSCLAFSADDARLASCNGDSVAIWDVREPTSVAAAQRHQEEVHQLAFSPNSAYLASTSWDRDLAVWSLKERRQMAVYQPPTDAGDEYALTMGGKDARAFVFTPDSQTLLTGGGRGKPIGSGGRQGDLVLWPFASGQPTTAFEDLPRRVQALALSPDGKRLATADARTIQVIDMAHQRTKVLLAEGGALCLAFDARGERLAAGSADNVLLWRLGTSEAPVLLSEHTQPVTQVQFAADGASLFSASFDGTVRIWDVSNGRNVRRAVLQHSADITDISVSKDGTLLASASKDQTIGLWQTKTGAPLRRLGEHESAVTSVAFDPSGRLLASAGADQRVFLWDVATGKRHVELRRPATLVAFSPDGHWLATAGGPTHRVDVWDIGLSDSEDRACATVNRNLSCKEWLQYFDETAYDAVCPNLPAPKTCVAQEPRPVPTLSSSARPRPSASLNVAKPSRESERAVSE